MSSSTPKAYPVVYDADNGLQYAFGTGYVAITVAGATNFSGNISVPSDKKILLGGPTSNVYFERVTASGDILIGHTNASGDFSLTTAPSDTAIISLNSTLANGSDLGATLELDPSDMFLELGKKTNGGSFFFKDNAFVTLLTLDATGLMTFTKAPTFPITGLATTGTITPDGRLGPTFTIVVAGAITLNGPSNGVDGQKVTFAIDNDASHSVTLATGAGNFRFGTDITSYTNSVSKRDYIGAIWNNGASRWDVVSVVKGF